MALDWGSLGAGAAGVKGSDVANPPVLLILPGIVGNSMDNYVQHLVEDGLLEGYRAVVFNQRGNGGIKLKVIVCVHIVVAIRAARQFYIPTSYNYPVHYVLQLAHHG